MTNWTDSKEHARQVQGILSTAIAYLGFAVPRTEDEELNAFWKEARRAISSAEKKVVEEAVERWSVKSDCELCRKYSVFGGPSHHASGSCRSGGRSHCSCDTCF